MIERGSLPKRVWNTLRSRRLAVWMLAAFIGYAAIGTSVPQLSQDQVEVMRWQQAHPGLTPVVRALGLFEAFSSPVLLAGLFVLGASTVLCAWERTRRARRLLRRAHGVPEAQISRLKKAEPALLIQCDVDEVRDRARRAIESVGLRVRSTSSALHGEAGRFGVLGSPLFHWSLALLFVVVALGQLTRSEGLIGVPVGDSGVVNEAANYGRVSSGALYGGAYRDIVLRVPRMELDHMAGGMSRGPAPFVQLVRDGRVTAEGWTYPNHPLRYGPLLVHYSEQGYFGRFTLVNESGAKLGESLSFFDRIESGGLTSARIDLSRGNGAVLPVRVSPVVEQKDAKPGAGASRKVSLSWSDASGVETTTVVALGDAAVIEGTTSLRFDEAGTYARLSVVDDWSVYPIYTLLTLAVLGVALAVFSPRRTATAIVTVDGDRTALRMATRHDRGDEVFRIHVEDALQREFGQTAIGHGDMEDAQ